MVLPAKIFEIRGDADLGLIVWKLKDFREQESYETEEGETVDLVTEILDLKAEGELISGIFSRDFVRRRFYRRKIVENPVTEEAPFWIVPSGGRTFMIVLAPSVARGVRKLLTNNVANKLSRVFFIEPRRIVEVEIPHDTLKELHESNPQSTKLIWFDQVDLPGVEKLCLSGSDVADTDLYHDYLQHGRIWYVVFEEHKRGIVVGITRNFVVTLFSKTTTGEFLDFIREDLLMLIQ